MCSPCLRTWRGSAGRAQSVGRPSPPRLRLPLRRMLSLFHQSWGRQPLPLLHHRFLCRVPLIFQVRCPSCSHLGCPAFSPRQQPGSRLVSGRRSWSLPCLPSRRLSKSPCPCPRRVSCLPAVEMGRSPFLVRSEWRRQRRSSLPSPCGARVSPQHQPRWKRHCSPHAMEDRLDTAP